MGKTETLLKTPANLTKIDELRTAMGAILAEALHRGFHGTATLEILVTDGTIQRVYQTIRKSVC